MGPQADFLAPNSVTLCTFRQPLAEFTGHGHRTIRGSTLALTHKTATILFLFSM